MSQKIRGSVGFFFFLQPKVNLNQQSNEPPDFLAALWGCNIKDRVLTMFTNILLNKYTIPPGSLFSSFADGFAVLCDREENDLLGEEDRKRLTPLVSFEW